MMMLQVVGQYLVLGSTSSASGIPCSLRALMGEGN